MAHHGSNDEKMSGALASLFGQQDATDKIAALREQIGSTGSFPQGVLSEDDKGGLAIGFTHTDEKVIMAFGDPVEWVGFDAEQARTIAQSLLDHAAECDGVQGRVRLVTD